MEMRPHTPPKSHICPSHVRISKRRESYAYAIVITALLTAISIAVFVHVREQLTLLEEGKHTVDPTSPQATALHITAYVAVLSNGAAAIVSYLLLERLNSGEPNEETTVTPLSNVLDLPSQRDPHEDEELGTLGKPQENTENTKPMTMTLGYTLRRWCSNYHQSFVEAYWLMSLLIGFLSPFVEFALYASVFEVRLVIRIIVVVFAVIAVIPLVSFWSGTLRTVHI
ncbi:hypothetical protein FRB91_004588 [Serendipita sp. 411]|nr:hypothetical protein FRC18_010127 [Serendipita sp. 400]KAG8860195.1 hypothetical protein FRB91_004588 [Serendipita sp. 411]